MVISMATGFSAQLLSGMLKAVRSWFRFQVGRCRKTGSGRGVFQPSTWNTRHEEWGAGGFCHMFECRQVHVSYDQALGEFRINNSAEALFDSVLQSHGLALADK